MSTTQRNDGGMRVTPTTIVADLSCGSCGYSLRGLGSAARCPECGSELGGAATRTNARRATDSGNLGNAPTGFLLTMCAGLLGMTVSGGLVAGSFMTLYFMGASAGLAAVMAVAGAAWLISVRLVLRPRPATHMDAEAARLERAEGRPLRVVARVTQPAVVAAAVATMLEARGGVGPWLALSLVCVTAMGWPAVSMLLSRLAEWSGDHSLVTRLRTITWGLVACPLVMATIFLGVHVVQPLWMLWWVGVFCAVGWLIAYVMLCVSSVQMLATTYWAVQAAKERAAIDARKLAKAQERERELLSRLEQADARRGADAQPASLVPPPDVPVPGERTTPRINPSRDVTPYGLEETASDDAPPR